MRYDALAPIYDRIMSHVEYDEWLLLLEKIVKKYLRKSSDISVLEIGGGTGMLGQQLIKSGYKYQGSDYSFSMSRESRKRKLPFVCADARHLPFKKQYDCILFLYDGINYFDSIDNYEKFFHQAAQCLKPGGLLLFDITTEYNSFQHFYDYLDFDEFSDCSVVRHSYYDEITTTQHNNFTIFTIDKKNPNLYKKYIEKHEQKVLPPQLIEETIPNSLYKILGIWDEFKMHRYTSRSERVHFLLQKNN